MTNFVFPDDILSKIREFSSPLLRMDWRTCKTHESKLIKAYDDVLIQKYQRTYTRIRINHNILYEVKRWTLYGRLRIFKEERGWIRRIATPQTVPTMDCPEVYLHLFKWMMCGYPAWQSTLNGDWIPVNMPEEMRIMCV
jgi:hypothetical protein